MRKYKWCIKFLSLAVILLITCVYFSFSCAEEQAQTAQVFLPKATEEQRNECLKNFDINNVDFNSPKAAKGKIFLLEYFQCRAAVHDDARECDNLSPMAGSVEVCRKNFDNYQAFFGRLLMAGRASPQILNACLNKFAGSNREDCVSLASAWLAQDVAVCEGYRKDNKKYNDCMAMVSGNEQSCSGNSFCIKRTSYLNAIRSGNIKECDRIQDGGLKTMCRGYISRDEKACEKNKGFEDFRNSYCE